MARSEEDKLTHQSLRKLKCIRKRRRASLLQQLQSSLPGADHGGGATGTAVNLGKQMKGLANLVRHQRDLRRIRHLGREHLLQGHLPGALNVVLPGRLLEHHLLDPHRAGLAVPQLRGVCIQGRLRAMRYDRQRIGEVLMQQGHLHQHLGNEKAHCGLKETRQVVLA